MGVFGLWDILLTTAQKLPIDKLSGKILAIDASIWLVKADSIFSQDSQKIRCILQKIVFLRKNNILPIFVFDGIPPAIKRKTLQNRRQKLRQGSQIDVRKKTQIQVMHLLQNAGKQKSDKESSKDKRFIEKEEKMGQIDKLLQNLSEIQIQKAQHVTDDDIMKIRLQSQVLTYKYQLMMEDPRLEGLEKMLLTQFQMLGIQQKLEYLHLLENQLYSRHSKKNKIQTIRQLSKLTPEEQILYDMDKIEKKTKLRQLQDELYRKTIQQNIKIENGFEIIEEIRNGKKFVMKRKINPENQKQGYFGRGNKKEKNDFSTILNYRKSKQNEDEQIKDDFDLFGNQPDPFLMDLIGKDLQKAKQEEKSKSKSLSFQPHLNVKPWKMGNDKEIKQEKKQKVRQSTTGNNKQKQKQKKDKKQRNTLINTNKNNFLQRKQQQSLSQQESSEQNQIVGSSLIGQKIKRMKQTSDVMNLNQPEIAINDSKSKSLVIQSQSQKPDNLPQFINYQNLQIRHLDTENHRNIQFQKLLEMIGIPYVKATSEAESQCARFQMEGLVDGVITEDSDVFLFGARNVFRGVFNDNIKYFSAHKILQKLKLNREKLIIFAMLLGSDYTDGIKGIGIVNAMEILKIFDDFDKLQKFKKWARYADILHSDQKNTTQNIVKDLSNDEQKQFYQFHKKFKNYWYIDDGFPKISVINAYLNPQVIDQARMKQMKETKYFELKEFNEEAVKIFMKQRLLMTYNQTEDYCAYLKKPFNRQKQKKMTDFFAGQDHEFAKIRSKRLMKALGVLNQEQQKQKSKKE